jgi:two-component system, sensor histidine kinase RpfC
MDLTATWRRRTSGPAGAELEQAALRLIISTIVTLYAWSLAQRVPSVAVLVLAGWIVVSSVLFVAVWRWPAANVWRRGLGMFVDVGLVTLYLFLADSGGVLFVWVYLFIIFGNAFRYGRAYLHASQLLSIVGFAAVALAAAWWREKPEVVTSWMMTLIVIPLYVGLLTDRINAARLRAEEALRECMGRAHHGS